MDGMLTVDEAAAQYGVNRRTIWRLYQAGLLPLHKAVGQRATLIAEADAERVLRTPRPRGRPRTRETATGEAEASL